MSLHASICDSLRFLPTFKKFHSLSVYPDTTFKFIMYQEVSEPQTCSNHLAGGTNAGVNARVGCEGVSTGGLGSGLGDASVHLCLAFADVDVVDVGVGLQCEDEANQVCGRKQHRNSVHQWPVRDIIQRNSPSSFANQNKSLPSKSNLLNLGENQVWVSLTLIKARKHRQKLI